MRVAQLVSTITLAAICAACAFGDAVVLSPRQLAAYDVNVLPYVAGHGLLAEISGDPFPAADGQLAAAVAEALARHHFGPIFPVYLERPEGFRSPYRAVMVFDPAPAPGRTTLCERVPDSQPDGERLRVAAAFCASDQLLSSVSGSVGGVIGPGDARFRQLLSQVSTELFPPFDDRGANADRFLP
jgi:hypothetical protein